MKYLAYVFSTLLCTASLILSVQLDKANQEIINLNSQINAFEIRSGQDSDKIKALEDALFKRLHSKKKVLCWDYDYAA